MDYFVNSTTVPCPYCHVTARTICRTRTGKPSISHQVRVWLALSPKHVDANGYIKEAA